MVTVITPGLSAGNGGPSVGEPAPGADVPTKPMRKFPLGLYGCIQYRDVDNMQQWWPDFCIYSLLLSNVMAGQTYSQAFGEEKLMYKMGLRGWCICLVSVPFSFYNPMAGMVCFGALSNYIREQVKQKYSVEDDNYFCCGAADPCLNFFHNALSYPCSLFQMGVSMERWERERKIAQGQLDTEHLPVANPVFS